MLLLKSHLVALVKAGKKRRPSVSGPAHSFAPARSTYTPGLGKMKITSIEELPNLAALTPADAIADGFRTLPALLTEIHKIYGKKIPPNRHLYRIRFQWPLTESPTHHPTPKPADSVAAGRSTPAPPSTVGNIETHRQHLAPPVNNRNSKLETRKSPSPSLAQHHTLRAYILAHAPQK